VSATFAKKLKVAGGKARMIELAGAGHGFTASPNNEFMRKTWKASLRFFEKHLGGPGQGTRLRAQ